MKQLFNTIAAACIASIIIVSGCGGQAPADKGKQPAGSGPTVILVENTSISLPIKQLKPDRVELIYFHTKSPCHCMAVVGDNIQYAVDTYFSDAVADGRLKLTNIISDDPGNAELVKQYDAMPFTLFIREVRGSEERLYPVSAIWEMTGDDNRDRLVEFVRSTLNNVMEGKSR
jgi:hypothetical protein